MSRRTVGTLLVVAWLASLGWLAARRLGPVAAESPGRAAVRLPPGAAFYAVTVGGRQIGTAGITLDTTALGYRILETISLDLPAGDGLRRDVLRAETVLSRGFRLEATQAALSEGGAALTVETRVGPDSTLVHRLARGGGAADQRRMPAPEEPVTTPAALPFRLAAGRSLRPGATQRILAWRVLQGRWAPEEARVGGDSVVIVSDSAVRDPGTAQWVAVAGDSLRAWRVERRPAGDLPVVDWVDGTGRVLRREHAFGITLEQSPFEVGFNNYQAALRDAATGPPPVVSGLRPPGPPASGTARDAPLRLLLRRWDGPAWPGAVVAVAGGRQEVQGDTVTIHPRPVRGADPTDAPRARHTRELSPVDRSALQEVLTTALPRPLAGEDTLAVLAAWVARAVLYVDSASGPTGIVTAARSGRGTLEDIVALYAALAELAGYPVRMVYGVDVGRPELPAHLWAEAWRDGWRAVDPARGTAPASTTLLRLGEGTTIRPLAVVPVLGGLRVTELR